MANHNFKEGIDWIADSTGNTPLGSHAFTAKNGNDANPDFDPTQPKLTLTAAANSLPANVASTVVAGAGAYAEFSLPDRRQYMSDNLCTINGTSTETLLGLNANTNTSIQGWYISDLDYIYNFNTGSNAAAFEYTGNIFVNCKFRIDMTGAGAGELRIRFEQCVFINCQINYIVSGTDSVKSWADYFASIEQGNFEGCIFISTDLVNETRESGGNPNCQLFNCYVDPDSSVIGAEVIRYSNVQGTIDQSMFGSPVYTNNISEDPQFSRPEYFDYTLQATSPMIGAGYGGRNITLQKAAFSFDKDNSDVSGGTITNVTFQSSGEWTLTNPAMIGTVETDVIDLGRNRVLGKISSLGTSDYLNDVPDFDNAATNVHFPNNLDFEMRWADLEADVSSASWEVFRFGHAPTFDGTRYNGEADFNWGGQSTISARYIQLRITLRPDYDAL